MRLVIKGDKDRNFDGKLKAIFSNDEKTFELVYDLDNWKNSTESGFIGGNYIQITQPIHMNLYFEQEYDLRIENARKIYTILHKNGWETL